jgi:hypothetical protein
MLAKRIIFKFKAIRYRNKELPQNKQIHLQKEEVRIVEHATCTTKDVGLPSSDMGTHLLISMKTRLFMTP